MTHKKKRTWLIKREDEWQRYTGWQGPKWRQPDYSQWRFRIQNPTMQTLRTHSNLTQHLLRRKCRAGYSGHPASAAGHLQFSGLLVWPNRIKWLGLQKCGASRKGRGDKQVRTLTRITHVNLTSGDAFLREQCLSQLVRDPGPALPRPEKPTS